MKQKKGRGWPLECSFFSFHSFIYPERWLGGMNWTHATCQEATLMCKQFRVLRNHILNNDARNRDVPWCICDVRTFYHALTSIQLNAHWLQGFIRTASSANHHLYFTWTVVYPSPSICILLISIAATMHTRRLCYIPLSVTRRICFNSLRFAHEIVRTLCSIGNAFLFEMHMTGNCNIVQKRNEAEFMIFDNFNYDSVICFCFIFIWRYNFI
jgi:hypothetical protein